MFVSGILIGCAFGRLFGLFVTNFVADSTHAPTYAIIGAVAILAGYARHTFSLAVILMESTENINLFIPMMWT